MLDKGFTSFRSLTSIRTDTDEAVGCIADLESWKHDWSSAVIRILVVDDDPRISAALVDALRRSDYDVTAAATAADALAADPVDLVLLDLGLPDMDGLELCNQLRKVRNVPIIAVTAKGAPSERLEGFHRGVDDYVVKPFSILELEARIEAVLRRTGLGSTITEPIEVDTLWIDEAGHTVTIDGRPVHLSRKEFELLAVLARHPGQTFTRADLLLRVWHTSWEGKSRTVDVHVGVLRQKTERPDLIETVHGVGYRLKSPTCTPD